MHGSATGQRRQTAFAGRSGEGLGRCCRSEEELGVFVTASSAVAPVHVVHLLSSQRVNPALIYSSGPVVLIVCVSG